MLDVLSKLIFILTLGEFGEQDKLLNFASPNFIQEEQNSALSSLSNFSEALPSKFLPILKDQHERFKRDINSHHKRNRTKTEPEHKKTSQELYELEKAENLNKLRLNRTILLLVPTVKSFVIWGVIHFYGFYSPLYSFIRDVSSATLVLSFAEYLYNPEVSSNFTMVVQWLNFIVWMEMIIEVHLIVAVVIISGVLYIIAPKMAKELLLIGSLLLMMSQS